MFDNFLEELQWEKKIVFDKWSGTLSTLLFFCKDRKSRGSITGVDNYDKTTKGGQWLELKQAHT